MDEAYVSNIQITKFISTFLPFLEKLNDIIWASLSEYSGDENFQNFIKINMNFREDNILLSVLSECKQENVNGINFIY